MEITGAITSLQNPRVKQAVALRDGRRRVRAGRYLIDGARELSRALASGAALETVFVCHELCTGGVCRQVLEQLETAQVEIWYTTPRVFEKLAYGKRAEGVLAIAVTPDVRLDNLALPTDACIGVLVGVEKPGNTGAVLRSADGAGLAALIAVDAGSDLFNPNCIRASLGTIFTLPVATASSAQVLAWLRERQFRIYAARPDANLQYTECDFSGPTALVLGSEAQGLPDAWQADDITAIGLPMRGQADSLNVSVTAGILFYEALRQRSAQG